MKATVMAVASKAQNKYLSVMALAGMTYLSAMDTVFGQTADPKAPLEFQKQAQDAARNSRINPDDAKSGLENLASTFLYLFGALSLIFAGYSVYKWWDAVNNEQSRNNAGRSAMAAIVASILGIVSVLMGWVQSIALGGN
ncbi:MAG: hypothetical protein KDK08_14910 [Rhizobiaceae bacterium]|nr:hypothetical protein [Rhizobiaceae bacterium]